MICPKCHAYLQKTDTVCPICFLNLLADEEQTEDPLFTFRQGRGDRRMPPIASTVPDMPKSGAAASGDEAGSQHRRRRGGGASRAPVDDLTDHRSEKDSPFHIYGEEHTDTGSYHRSGSMNVTDRHPEPEFLTSSRRRNGGSERGESPERIAAERKRAVKKASKRRRNPLRRFAINWAHVGVALIVLLLIAVSGFGLWLTQTAAGNRQQVRWGMGSTTIAKWEVGQEYLDQGEIGKAITLFEAAREEEGEEVDVDNLLMLGSAYEAEGRLADAEALYTDLYTNIVPTRSEAYANVIRIMLADGRRQQAAELMETAYTMTGRSTFRAQREALIPAAPEVNIVGGYYTEEKSLVLLSPEGYDVYYTMDPAAQLPEEGTLYRRPIALGEGTHTIRAMSVNGDLKSDILSTEYRIYLPSPRTPGCNLAPNTYKARKTPYTVSLRVNEENKFDKDITIFYTIDGSNPDADSPMWTGEPIVLPTGRVTLKAIAVNGNGKVSNQLEVGYKIEGKNYPLEAYDSEDRIGNLSLYYSGRSEFLDAYGSGSSKEEVTVPGFSDTGMKYTYPWGYAVFARKTNTSWVLTELFFTAHFNGPRGTGIGSTMSDIVGKFKDLGQVESPSGKRGLYYSTNSSGRILVNEDGTKSVRYITNTSDGYYWTLLYKLNAAGTCESIDWSFSKYLQ